MPKLEGFKKYHLLVGSKPLATFLCHLENEEGVVLVWVLGEVDGDEQLRTHTAVTWDIPRRAALGEWWEIAVPWGR